VNGSSQIGIPKPRKERPSFPSRKAVHFDRIQPADSPSRSWLKRRLTSLVFLARDIALPLVLRLPPPPCGSSLPVDVAVTNYLERAHDPPSLSLRLGSQAGGERGGKESRLLSSPPGHLFLPFGLHFCAAKRNTYMDFVTGERSFRAGVYRYTAADHCFAPVRPNSVRGRDSRTVLISNSNWRQFFERIFDLLYRRGKRRAASVPLLSPAYRRGSAPKLRPY